MGNRKSVSPPKAAASNLRSDDAAGKGVCGKRLATSHRQAQVNWSTAAWRKTSALKSCLQTEGIWRCLRITAHLRFMICRPRRQTGPDQPKLAATAVRRFPPDRADCLCPTPINPALRFTLPRVDFRRAGARQSSSPLPTPPIRGIAAALVCDHA